MIKDQLNRTLKITQTPKRIISLVPSLTELLVDLGLEEKIVGVTRFCVHPKHIKKIKVIVGGTKKVNYNKIKGLQPDFILTNKEENTLEIVENCAKIAPTFVTDLNSITAVTEMINQLGKILNCSEKATTINNLIQSKQTQFLKSIQNTTPKKVAYFIWENPFMVAGNNTFINELLKLNRFKNIFDELDRYPIVELEKLKKVDYIFLSSEPYPFKEKHKDFFKKYTNAKIVLVDGEYFSWYGSRLLKAFDYFTELHKSLKKLEK